MAKDSKYQYQKMRWYNILSLYKYTDKEIEQIVKSIVILTDTREQKNDHILSWLDKKGIAHKSKALSNGDYSFFVPANPLLNIERDLFLATVSDGLIRQKDEKERASCQIRKKPSLFENMHELKKQQDMAK